VERASPRRLILAGAAGIAVAYLFAMPFGFAPWTAIAGVPVPAGTLFAVGLVGMHAARARRRLHQTLRALVVALFFAYGLPLIVTPFAPAVRLVFYLVLAGAAVTLYEWTVPD
jgi:hypothetical protein